MDNFEGNYGSRKDILGNFKFYICKQKQNNITRSFIILTDIYFVSLTDSPLTK